MSLSFSLADGSPALLELIDLSGRRVLVRDVGGLGAGRFTPIRPAPETTHARPVLLWRAPRAPCYHRRAFDPSLIREGEDPVKRLLTVLLCLGVLAFVPARAAEKSSAKNAPVPAQGALAAQADTTSAPKDSVDILAAVVARDSSQFEQLYDLGVKLLDRDRAPEAMRVLTRAHVLQPKDFRVTINLGAALDAMGRAEVAQPYYREALAEQPGDSVAMCRLASSLYSQGKYGDAIDMLRQVIKQSPQAYCAYFTMGVAFADAGIYRDAIRMWQKVVDLAPNSPEAISARESIDVLQKVVQ